MPTAGESKPCRGSLTSPALHSYCPPPRARDTSTAGRLQLAAVSRSRTIHSKLAVLFGRCQIRQRGGATRQASIGRRDNLAGTDLVANAAGLSRT
jgi:hypothetical protein